MADETPDSVSSAVERYTAATETSRELYEQACRYMPGGSTRDAVYFPPYPTYAADASGCYLTDVDNNEYLDFVNNMTSLIHGHASSDILDPAIDAAREGTAPGAPTRLEIDWAKHLCERLPAVDSIRFTNSGTEATMNAIRAARAYTGNNVIAKFEGVYHGTHDDAQLSIHPPRHLAGAATAPNSVPDSAGLPAQKPDKVLVLPFNDSEATIARLREHRDELAGVIIAPLMGSVVVPAADEFLAALADFTKANDIPLIFDEVIACRIDEAGAHAAYNIEPDLVTLGKLIGGGFPVGAFGGRAGLMEMFDPRSGKEIVHSGTFNANPVTAAAGLGALEAFDASAVERLNDHGRALVDAAREVFAAHDLNVSVNHAGSLFRIFLTPGPVTNYRDTLASSHELERLLFFELLDEGVRLTPSLMGSLSTPMGEREVERFSDSLDAAVGRLRTELVARNPVLDS
jgi:glutamate-1-semialdehyde 2,1-aminomutase